MLEVLHIKERIIDAQVDSNAEFAAKIAALQEERKQLVERLKTVDTMLEQTRKQQVRGVTATIRRTVLRRSLHLPACEHRMDGV
jgi:Tfp pilus assembly protein PilO